jgi:hypothetical protein
MTVTLPPDRGAIEAAVVAAGLVAAVVVAVMAGLVAAVVGTTAVGVEEVAGAAGLVEVDIDGEVGVGVEDWHPRINEAHTASIKMIANSFFISTYSQNNFFQISEFSTEHNLDLISHINMPLYI